MLRELRELREVEMRNRRVFGLISGAAVVLVAVGFLKLTAVPVAGQAGGAATAAVKTAWGDPDLQGIWNQAYNTPLQRAARYADREFLTAAERKAQDEARTRVVGRDRRSEVGTERDVAGAYNAVFTSIRPRGERTSLIVDPKDGKLPPTTPEAQKIVAMERSIDSLCCRTPRPARTRTAAMHAPTGSTDRRRRSGTRSLLSTIPGVSTGTRDRRTAASAIGACQAACPISAGSSASCRRLAAASRCSMTRGRAKGSSATSS